MGGVQAAGEQRPLAAPKQRSSWHYQPRAASRSSCKAAAQANPATHRCRKSACPAARAPSNTRQTRACGAAGRRAGLRLAPWQAASGSFCQEVMPAASTMLVHSSCLPNCMPSPRAFSAAPPPTKAMQTQPHVGHCRPTDPALLTAGSLAPPAQWVLAAPRCAAASAG